jgi:hypothetical protein
VHADCVPGADRLCRYHRRAYPIADGDTGRARGHGS